jgi:ribosomal 50S subunit-recycling heat shock protein
VIDANEGAFVSYQDALFQQSIVLKAQEGAEIEVLLDVQKVTTKTVSGGIVSLKGAAKTQSHRVSAGGVVDSATLDSEQVEVRVKAGGTAAVRATELAEANVYGQPKKLVKKIAIGGSISIMDNAPKESPANE